MKLLTELDSLDNVKDGETRILPTKVSQLQNDSGYITGLVMLEYGKSTWQEFQNAFNSNKIVYCKVNGRMAFLAYISTSNVEFQYYRSLSSPSVSSQPDEVYVYTLTNANKWTTTTRKASSTIDVGTGLSRSYTNSSRTMKLSVDTSTIAQKSDLPTKTSDLTNNSGFITGITSTDVTTALGYTPYDSSNPSGYTTNTGTITGVSVNGTSVATSGVANITSVPASVLSGAIPSAVTATTQTSSDNSTKIATTAFVKTAIDNLPEPMVFKGSLGTGGTITSLPTNGTATVGDTYKVITDGTYASKAAKVGDTFICLTKTSSANTWELIPSGDDTGGTVTSVKINATSPIAIDNNAAITTSGERTISHANSGVTAGTYKSVTVDSKGHVTAGTNPTTLSGYGITDAKISNGTIILGSNTITPSTVQNIKDGSTIGSLRSIRSSAEDTNYTIGNDAFAEGYDTKASGDSSHAEGGNTTASEDFSHAEGSYTVASGLYSHSEGYYTTASDASSHAEGFLTKAISGQSHAEGFYTTASGVYSHAEGSNTTASGTSSHAEGNHTTASGASSHSEGDRTTASGEGSHVEGYYTTAGGDYQHVFGKYNVIDNNSTYVEIVGNGNYNSSTKTTTRANARTLDWNGNEVLAGKLTVGANPTANMDVATKQYVDDAVISASPTDVQINGTSITSDSVANIITQGTYNASSNKIATMSDITPATTLEVARYYSTGTKVATLTKDEEDFDIYVPIDSSISSSSPSTTNLPTSSAVSTFVNSKISTKQDTLTSGTNIKTVNNTSLLGSGNISVQPTLISGTNIKTINSTSLLGNGNITVQPTLVSGTNIKTINNTSLLGSGNINTLAPTSLADTYQTSGHTYKDNDIVIYNNQLYQNTGGSTSGSWNSSK